MADKIKQIYDLYVQSGLINSTPYEKFAQATPEQQQELYNLGKSKGLFNNVDPTTFMSAFQTMEEPTSFKKKDDTEYALAVGSSDSKGSEEWKPNNEDLRVDGTKKGTGYLGVLKRPDGDVSSEISIGVNIDGNETEIPTLVPSLSKKEIDYLLSSDINNKELFNTEIGKNIQGKATSFARERIKKGLSPFYQEGESVESQLNIVTPDLINENEEYVVPKMRYHFGDMGFKFDEAGATGDWMDVTAPNGKKIQISLDPFSNSKAQTESYRLKNFISENSKSIPSDRLAAIDEKYKAESKKFTTQNQIDSEVADISSYAQDLDKEANDLVVYKNKIQETKDYLQSVPVNDRDKGWIEKFNATQALEQEVFGKEGDIKERLSKLSHNQWRLSVAAGKYVDMKAEQGSGLGFIRNNFAQGWSDLAAGVARKVHNLETELAPVDFIMNSMEARNILRSIASSNGIKVPEDSQLPNGEAMDKWMDSIPSEVRQEIIDSVQDAAKKEFGKSIIPTILDSHRNLWGDKTTTKAYEQKTQEGFWGGAIGGLAKSLPAMMSGGPAARVAAMYLQTDEAVQQEMDSNPSFNNVSENEKELVKMPISIASAVLEEFGFRNVIANKGLLNGLVMKAIGKATAETTAKTFGELVRNEVKSAVARGALTLTGAALAEGETGATQQISEFGVKSIYNEMKDKGLLNGDGHFENVPKFLSGDYFKQVAVAGAQEAVGGFILGAPHALAAAARGQGFTGMSDNDFLMYRAAASDDKVQTMFVTSLKNKVASGEMSLGDAKNELNDFRKARGLFSLLPEGLDVKQQKEALNLIREREAIKASIEGKDKALVVNQNNKIERINERLVAMSEEAAQSQGQTSSAGGVAAVDVEANKADIEKSQTTTVLSTSESTAAALESLPTDDKVNTEFTQSDGTVSPVIGNEKMLADLYHEAIAIDEDQRTESHKSAIDAVETMLSDIVAKENEASMISESPQNMHNVGTGVPITDNEGIIGLQRKNGAISKLAAVAARAYKAVGSALPNFNIYMHDTDESYDNTLDELGLRRDNNGKYNDNGRFSYDGKNMRIDIRPGASPKTIAHEVAHAILYKTFGEDPEMFKQFRGKISKALLSGMDSKLTSFANMYMNSDGSLNDVNHEEYLVELAALLQSDLKRTSLKVYNAIASAINEVVSKVTNGRFKPFQENADAKDVVSLISSIAESIKKGKEFSNIKPRGDTRSGNSIGSRASISEKKKTANNIANSIRAGEDISNINNIGEIKFVSKSQKEAVDKAIDHKKESGTTQVATTIGSYEKAAKILKSLGVNSDVLDYGAGLGLGSDAMSKVLGFNVDSFEPNSERWSGKNKVTFKSSNDIDKKYSSIVSLNVLNVVEKDTRDLIVKDIYNNLKDGGTAVISARKWSGDVNQAKNAVDGGEKNSLYITRTQGGKEVKVFQKGFDGNELVDYIKDLLGDNVTVEKNNSFGAAGVVIKKTGNIKSKAQVVYDETGFISVPSMIEIVKSNDPTYLCDVMQHIMEMGDKLKNGAVTTSDLSKAYMMAVSSIMSGDINADTFENNIGEKVDPAFLEPNRKIRTEGAMAYLLTTDRGSDLLKHIKSGKITEEDKRFISGAMKPFGMFGEGQSKYDSLFGKTEKDQINLTNINEFKDLLKNGVSSTDELFDKIRRLKQISQGKVGFIANLLGIGERGVIDTREIKGWLRGSIFKGELTEQELSIKKELTKSLNNLTPLQKEILSRMREVGRAMGIDESLAEYIGHHMIWDAVAKEKTTHDGLYLAMTQNKNDFNNKLNNIKSKSQLSLEDDLVGKNPELKKEMTEDGKGNYIFYHYSPKKLNKISPSKFGTNTSATGRDEHPGTGMSMYYTRKDVREQNISGSYGYVVRVPKEKVYPFNSDPKNFYDKAKVMFEKQYPGQAFGSNKQIAFVSKVAAENGFPMTVAEWNVGKSRRLRAQTTEEMKPESYITPHPQYQSVVVTNPEIDKYKPNAKIKSKSSLSDVEATAKLLEGKVENKLGWHGILIGQKIDNEQHILPDSLTPYHDGIYTLMEVPISKLNVKEKSNSHFNDSQYKFDEFKSDKEKLPPIEIVEKPDGSYEIINGEHRAVVSKEIGDEKILAFVREKNQNTNNLLGSKYLSDQTIRLPKTKETLPKNVAEAYHKAKADGTNPELVKAVEQSLKESSIKSKSSLSSVGVGEDVEINEKNVINGGGEVGTFNFKSKSSLNSPKASEDSRDFIRNLVEDVDIRDFNGKKFVTNMYDYTTAGEVDLGNEFKINMLGGKSYVPYMMSKNNKTIGDVSNLAAFNTKGQAESFVRNAISGNAELFAPHSGTLSASWQFQQHTFAELVNVILDGGIMNNDELINTFNKTIKSSSDNKKAFKTFKNNYKKNIRNFNSFKSDPKEIVKLLDIQNNFSPDLRKALNNAISADKIFQKAIGIKNKEEFFNKITDPLNKGVSGGELISIVAFDPKTFEIVKTEPTAIDHHPSFGWTLLAKINGIYQPTEFHKSSDVTNSYTKYNLGGESVSRKAEDPNYEQKNVSSSAGAIPKIAEFGNIKSKSSLSTVGVVDKSDADIEKRMAELEGAKIGTPELAEFNALEKEMEKRERNSVFNVPLEKVNDAVDALTQKEKEQPNGYGSFIEKRDARETKEVADRYLNAKELTDAELKKDFSDAVRGNPTTWYADGLKMREALKEATNRGIDTKDMLAEVTKVYENAGYDTKTAKSVVAGMLKPVFEGSQKEYSIKSKSSLSEKEAVDAMEKARAQGYSEGGIATFLKNNGVDTVVIDRIMKDNKSTSIKYELSEALLPGYDALIDDVANVIQGLQEVEVDAKTIASTTIEHVENSDIYKDATDIQKEKLRRDINSYLDIKMKSAPKVERLFGDIKNANKITMSERELLKNQIKSLARGAKDAKIAWVRASQTLASSVKDLVKKGKISVKQAASVLSRFSKVNMFNPDSIDRFVTYMSNVFEHADYADKIGAINKMLPNARKNIRTKIGLATQLYPSLSQLFTIKPTLIPMDLLGKYSDIVTQFGERAAVLSNIKDIEEVTKTVAEILERINEQELLAQELKDRFDATDNKVYDKKTKELDYAETVKEMLAAGEITEDEAAIMKKYRTTINPEVKVEKTAAEIAAEEAAEKIELLKALRVASMDPSLFSNKDERTLVQDLMNLIKRHATKELNNEHLRNLLKVINNINEGYVPHYAELMKQRMQSVLNEEIFTSFLEDAKPLKLEAIIARFKSLFNSKNAIENLVNRSQLFSMAQVFGDFKTTRLFDSILRDVAERSSLYTAKLGGIQERINKIDESLSKAFGRNPTNVKKSKQRIMAYLLQLEYESNPEVKGVHSALDYLNKTVEFIRSGESALSERDAESLEEIINEESYRDSNGEISASNMYDTFNDAEKKAVSEIQDINKSMEDVAMFTSAVIRGDKLSPISNYIHHNTLMSQSNIDINNSASDIAGFNNSLKPSTKAKSLIERTGALTPINFDVLSAVNRSAKGVLMDYFLTSPIKTARMTLSSALKNKNLTDTQKKIARAINSGFESAVTNMLTTNFNQSTIADDIVDEISRQGYRATLVSAERFVAELISNISGAVIVDPIAFKNGMTKFRSISFGTQGFNILNTIKSVATQKLYPHNTLSGKVVDPSILKKSVGTTGGKINSDMANILQTIYNNTLKPVKNGVELIADTLISTPDKVVSRLMYFGCLDKKFSEITGEDIDMEKLEDGDEEYMNKNKEAIEEAKRYADFVITSIANTSNPFMGTLKSQIKANDSSITRALKIFNNYMVGYSANEFIMARTGIYAAMGDGMISRRQGVALLSSVVIKNMVYALLIQSIGQALIGIVVGHKDDDDEEDEKSIWQKFGQAFASATSALLLGRNFGNVAKLPINYGIEKINQNYLEFLRNGEYDPYKDAIQFSNVPTDGTEKFNLPNFLASASGPYSPAAKTALLIGKKISEKEKTTDEASTRSDREKYIRIPLEVLGNSGMIPMYKDIRKVTNAWIYKDLIKSSKSSSSDDSMSEADMKRYFPDTYNKLYGKGTDMYEINKKKRELQKEANEMKQKMKDEIYGYVPITTKKQKKHK